VIAKVGKPNLKVMYDFYHVQVMQGDVLKRMEAHLPLIGHVQFAGPPARVPPQHGELNYPVIFDAIDAMGWKGWVGAEYGPGGPTADSLAWGKPYGIG
jgi:hydroxypyruvate isomerase